MVAALTRALELQLRLLHSSEADPAAVGRMHESFSSILDRLAKRSGLAHIRHYSDFNREEFERVELDQLSGIAGELDVHSREAGELLALRSDRNPLRFTMEELLERMLDLPYEGAPNQFTDEQRAAIVHVLSPEQYYGVTISGECFDAGDGASRSNEPDTNLDGENDDASVSAQLGQTVRADSGTGSAPGLEPEAASDPDPGTVRSADDSTATSLRRIKAQVMIERLRHEERDNEDVLAVAVLRVKEWLATHPQARWTSLHSRPEEGLSAGPHEPGIEVYAAGSRRLVFLFHSPRGNRALFRWVATSDGADGIWSQAGIPHLAAPSVALVLISASGEPLGAAWVALSELSGTPVEGLADLIKRLEFSEEYLALLSLTTARDRPVSVESSAHDELLQIAESL